MEFDRILPNEQLVLKGNAVAFAHVELPHANKEPYDCYNRRRNSEPDIPAPLLVFIHR